MSIDPESADSSEKSSEESPPTDELVNRPIVSESSSANTQDEFHQHPGHPGSAAVPRSRQALSPQPLSPFDPQLPTASWSVQTQTVSRARRPTHHTLHFVPEELITDGDFNHLLHAVKLRTQGGRSGRRNQGSL